MNSTQQPNPNNLLTRATNAFRTAIVLAIAFIGTFGLYFFLYQQSKLWQLGILAIVTGIVVLLNIAAIALSQRNQIERAATLMIAGMFLLFPFAVSLISGVGLVLGVGGALGIFMIAALTLEQKNLSRALMAGIVLGVGVILLDLFPVTSRLTVPVLRIYIPVVAALGLGVFAYYISREFSSYSFRTKLIVLLLSIAAFAITTVAISTNSLIRSELNQQAGINVKGQAESIGSDIILKLESEIHLLQVEAEALKGVVTTANRNYGGDPDKIRFDILALDEIWINAEGVNSLIDLTLNNPTSTNLRNFQAVAPDHVEIFVTDLYGANIAATNRTSDYYQADEEWWQNTFNNGEGAIYIGQPEFDESSQTYALILAVPIYDRQNVIGILRSTLQANYLIDLLENEKFGNTGQVDIRIDNENLLGREELLTPSEISDLTTITNTYNQITFQGSPSLLSEIPLQFLVTEDDPSQEAVAKLGWSIIVHQDVSEALAAADNQTKTTTMITLALLALTAIIGYVTSQWIMSPIISLSTLVKSIATGDLRQRADIETADEIGELARSFNTMTSQLQDTLGGLERRVSERTADLEIARLLSERRAQELQSISEISRTISTEQRLDVLLPLITRLVSERFNFYHVGIFFVDEARRYAYLQATNSEGGQRMLARGHRLELGTGLVGTVAQTGKTRIALDVGTDASFFNNPDLPDTHSEMALPLSVRGRTIGALDVQSTKAGAFTESDANTLSILADQVAIAIENARLFGETQLAREEAENLYAQVLSREWSAFVKQEEKIGYRKTGLGGRRISKPVDSEEIREALSKGQVIVVESKDNKEQPSIAVPVKLRGQTIGVLNIKAPVKNRRWSKDEVTLAQAVSDRLALALDNVRLLQESQRRAAKEAKIGEVTAKIGSSINMSNVLQTAVEELGKALPGSEVLIQFGEEQDIPTGKAE
jgi:GAF domain-containing protein/HAMP domain-containing protein